MSDLDEAEIIDLTNIPCYDYNPRLNSRRVGSSIYQEIEEVIDLVNDSLCDEINILTEPITCNKKKPSKEKGGKGGKSKNTTVSNEGNSSKKFGECPICRNELGSKPLASTKCGHVYCLPCIESALKFNKLCPTCRCSLKGNTAYHPLYLELG